MEVCGELLDKVYHHITGDIPVDTRKRGEPCDQKMHSKIVPSSAPEKLRPLKEGSTSSLGRPKSFSCINELQPLKQNVIEGSEKIAEEQKDEDNKAENPPDQR